MGVHGSAVPVPLLFLSAVPSDMKDIKLCSVFFLLVFVSFSDGAGHSEEEAAQRALDIAANRPTQAPHTHAPSPMPTEAPAPAPVQTDPPQSSMQEMTASASLSASASAEASAWSATSAEAAPAPADDGDAGGEAG